MQVQPGTSAKVSVANRERVYSKGTCPAVSFCIDNQNFEADFFVIPLDGFDIVLWVTWLQTLGPILWDFVTLEMSFTSSRKQVVFRGQQTCLKLQLQLLHDLDEHHSKLEQVLAEFADLFQEPTGLPPMRNCDYRICLLPGSKSVVVRPYQYPHLQKDEIEKSVRIC
ncbi:uncharacterized protein [Nicotiana tomentosiformis]|uniref:uncharacterized protein n=1 Tax=Nicotiana tomentosiformis TaxID=4098 RepID=UPI00388C4EFA